MMELILKQMFTKQKFTSDEKRFFKFQKFTSKEKRCF